MTLSTDVARCSGYENGDTYPPPGCDTCQRRTDRTAFPFAYWVAPWVSHPDRDGLSCELRIPPDAERAAAHKSTP